MENSPLCPQTEKSRYAPVRDSRLSLSPRIFALSSFSRPDDTRFEIEFFEELISKDPCNEEALMVLANTYTRCGEYEKCLGIDRRLARLRPADPTVYYNLACSHCLLRHLDEAFAALGRSIALGYRDASHITKDPDLANLRSDPRFRRLLGRLFGRSASDS